MKRNIVVNAPSKKSADIITIQVVAPDQSGIEYGKPVSHNADKQEENLDKLVCVNGTPLQTDRWIYRMVVGALSLTLVSAIAGAVLLQSQDKEIPEILIGLGTGSLGGLAGLLAPTPSKE
jgi:hypothetical protein